ncbi:unnamed protein product [Peniophora sp. CBMAI 1063]|nr:unnamed protein product [Peniophora sp. CBMAI 1063]
MAPHLAEHTQGYAKLDIVAELPLPLSRSVPTYDERCLQVAALLQEKPWARAFALTGGIGWRLTMLIGGQSYVNAVAKGPSGSARAHGDELEWPADYVWDEAPGCAYDMLSGRSGQFGLWPPQDLWDTIFSNGLWTAVHEEWFQDWLTFLKSAERSTHNRAVQDDHWWGVIENRIHSKRRPSMISHLPHTSTGWATRAGVGDTTRPVLVPVGDQKL